MAKTAFKQCDVERAIRAAKAVGIEHPTVDFPPEGGFRLLTLPPRQLPATPDRGSWDDFLNGAN